jgi:fibronectin-binding autotransporter adhesin
MNAYNFQEIASSTLVLNRAENGAAVNETLGSFNGDNTLTVNAGSNVTSGTPTLSFGNVSVANGNLAFIANSAEISLGNVNGTAGDASLYTLTLENNTTAASGTSTVTGSISDGPLGGILNLTRSTGNGTWVLSGVNSYSGVTSVQNGSLEIENNSALGDGLGSSSSAVNVSNGAVLQMLGGITTTTAIPLSLNGTGISGATFGALESVSGNNTYTGLVSIAGSSILIGSDTAGNTLTLSNSGTIIDTANSAGLLTFTGSGNIVVDSVIGLGAGAVGKSGAGTAYLEGASTYTGVTTISAGTLSTNLVANGGSASGIGAGSSAAAELVINGGTFQYTGAGASTNRNFTIGTSNATIDASGAGALVMTGTAAYSSVNNLETLTFTGTSAAVNTYAGALADNGTKMLNVTKAGSGVWNLSGVSTYSGTTSVTGGTLLVSGSLSGSGPVTVTNSTLGGSGYINGPASGLSIGSGGVLAPGALSGSAGTVLTVGNSVYLNGGSTLEINIDATTNATDLLYLSSGSLELSGDDTLTINILNGTQLTASNYVLAYLNNIGGNILGTFANVNIPTGYSVDYGDENGAELQLIAIPEPETWAILVCGMGMLVCLQRIKRRTRGSSFRIG